jgi:hypothetical protein
MDLQVESLLKRITDLGGQITIKDGKASLKRPTDPKNRKLVEELIPHLTRLRGEILVHFGVTVRDETGEHPGKHCGACKATVYTDSPEIANCCDRDDCPWWVPGCGVREEQMAKFFREQVEAKEKERRKSFAIAANKKKQGGKK